MASSGNNTTKNIIVNLKVLPGDTVKTIQDLQTKIANLKSTMEGMKAAGMENSETYIKLQATLKELEQGVRANQKVLRDSIREQQSNSDSINALRAQIRNLRAEYENLSKAERESAEGTELLDKISTLTSELKNLEEVQLDFTRNVGNYKSALEGLPFGKVIAGFNTLSQGTGKLSVALTNAGKMAAAFGKQLLKLLANPFVAAFAAIVAVVMKLTDAFKKNDDAMTVLQSLFAAFKPILDVINKAFSALVDVLAKAINGVSAFIQKVASFIPGLKQYAEAEEDVVRSSDQLEEAEREHALTQAKRNKEISELRDKSVESDKYSFEQRKGFLQQAMDLERENLKEQKEDAVKKLKIAEQEAALEIGLTELTQEAYAKLSDEKKNQLNQLRIAVVETETAFNDGTRRMRSQMSSFTKQEQSERKQRAQQAAQARKERQKNEREALKELENMMISGIRDLQQREIAQMKAGTKQQIDEIKDRLKTEKNLTAKARKALNDQIILLEADLQIRLSEARERMAREDWKNTLDAQKKYYKILLDNLTTEEARVAVRLWFNEKDSEEQKKLYKDALDEVVRMGEDAEKDLADFNAGSIDLEKLVFKYKSVWEEIGAIDKEGFDAAKLTAEDTAKYMNGVITKYGNDRLRAETIYQNMSWAIDRATHNERLRIQKDGEDKEFSLAKKHKELMLELERQDAFDAYGKNELAKTQLLLEQSRQRLEIVKDEYARLAEMRAQYNDNELAAMYGSVENYNNALAEAELGVVNAENNVADALKNLNVVNAQVKSRMIGTATAVMSAMESVAGSIGDVFNTLAESDEKYEGWALAMAEIQILISTAISIAEAIQGAVTAAAQTGVAAPFTTPVFIAEMVAIVVGAIASATTTLLKAKNKGGSAPKFAEGGLVGRKETRRKDDTVDAKLSLGEYVIPSDVVSDLGADFFDRLTGRKIGLHIPKLKFAEGGLVTPSLPDTQHLSASVEASLNYESVKEAMKEAVMEMPAPVVSVKEVTNAQKRVRVKESTARS